MIRILTFFILASLFSYGILPAQAIYSWEYDDALAAPTQNGLFNHITRVAGNGYILTGRADSTVTNQTIPMVVRLDDYGQEVLKRRFPYLTQPPYSPSLLGGLIAKAWPTSDGGFIVGVEGDRNWIFKFDVQADTVWKKEIPNNITSPFRSMVLLENGNVVYNRALLQSNPSRIEPDLLWLDSNGVAIDSIVLTNLGMSYLLSLTAAPGNGLYLVGMDSVADNQKVIKLDAAGNVEWSNTVYTQSNLPASSAVENMMGIDSNFVVGIRRARGNTWPNNYMFAWEVQNLSQNGTLNWQITLPDAFGFTSGYFGGRMQWTVRDDGVLIACLRDTSDIKLMAVSPNGTPLWNKVLVTPPNYSNFQFQDIAAGVENTGTFVIAGSHFNLNQLPAAISIDSLGNFPHLLVEGKVYADTSNNCSQDPNEWDMPNSLIIDGSGSIVALTDSNGEYDFIQGVGTSTFTTEPIGNQYASIWGINCPASDSHAVTYTGTPVVDTVSGLDFALEKLLDCPLMTVEVNTPFLRFCSQNTYYVDYCNYGSVTANNAYIILVIDSALGPVQIPVPYTVIGQDSFQVAVGNLNPGDCGSFQFTATVGCNLPFQALTHCVSAHIYPDSLCGAPSPSWNGAKVEVDGWCGQNDTVWFEVSNTGSANMLAGAGIWVVEDDILRISNQFQLNAGEDSTFYMLGNGSTWTTMAEQVPFYPFPSIPRATVEACGINGIGGVSLGFVNDFEDDDRSAWISIACNQVVAAVDPNDKTGFPEGHGPTHQIFADGEMEYLIRFQNTGSDTAFTVRIKDTLPSELDLTTFISGASSDPYSITFLPGNAVEWTFSNILLPDSTTDEANSHGFVKYRMMQNPGLTLGTEIKNKAGIIFDFMSPVITNTTLHTIGELELVVSLDEQADLQRPGIQVYPNPSSEVAHFDLGIFYEEIEVQVFDLGGKLIRHQVVGGAESFSFERNGLPEGMYLFRVTSGSESIGTGKMIIRNR